MPTTQCFSLVTISRCDNKSVSKKDLSCCTNGSFYLASCSVHHIVLLMTTDQLEKTPEVVVVTAIGISVCCCRNLIWRLNEGDTDEIEDWQSNKVFSRYSLTVVDSVREERHFFWSIASAMEGGRKGKNALELHGTTGRGKVTPWTVVNIATLLPFMSHFTNYVNFQIVCQKPWASNH